jgi:REP element-mobilizing transposase RayT
MERVFCGRILSRSRHPLLLTYLITFSCYGSHLHGDERGSIDPKHNQPGSRVRPGEPALQRFERQSMKNPPYVLDAQRRQIVLRAIVGVCEHRGWTLHAAHVRANHVHIVVDTARPAGEVTQDVKAYASRMLNQLALDPPEGKRWTRHASMRGLPDRTAREAAIRYVAARQGDEMALYVRAP